LYGNSVETANENILKKRIRRLSREEMRRYHAHPLRKRVDGRTAKGHRIRRAYADYVTALGNPTDRLVLANCASAAELRIAVEDLTAKQIAGEDVAEDLVRMANLLHRLERKIGIVLIGQSATEGGPPRPITLNIFDKELLSPGEAQDGRGASPPMSDSPEATNSASSLPRANAGTSNNQPSDGELEEPAAEVDDYSDI
jgi:hypothetical protein